MRAKTYLVEFTTIENENAVLTRLDNTIVEADNKENACQEVLKKVASDFKYRNGILVKFITEKSIFQKFPIEKFERKIQL